MNLTDEQCAQLRAFSRDVLHAMRDGLVMDPPDVESLALHHGLIEPTVITELPCGQFCNCNVVGMSIGDQCLRNASWLADPSITG